MEPYQLWLVIGSSATLVLTGLGILISYIKNCDSRIRDLEMSVAVLKAILAEREK